MSGIRDVVARMAADAAFAERVRSHPDEVAQQYGLSSDEIDKVRSLAEADAQSGPEPLGVRLSKSGITGGVLAGFLAGAADPMATAEGGDVSKAEFVTFDPQPDPPGGPHVAEAALGGPDTTTAGDPGDDAGIIIHWTPDPDAFDYGVPDTQPADGSDGGIIINWKPELDAFDDPDSQGIIIHDMPDPADGAYGVPDTTPDPNDADAKGIIINDRPEPTPAEPQVQEIAITKVADGAGIGELSIIDDGDAATNHGDAPGLEPGVEIKNLKLAPPTLVSDPSDTNVF